MKKKSALNQNEKLANNINPKLPISTFDRSHKQHTTFDAGKLVPITWDEILPGDTVKLNVDALIRSVTPIAPTMDNAKLTIHAFFVPTRLIWTHWQNFLGENTSKWTDNLTPKIVPQITANAQDAPNFKYTVNDLAGYLNLPLNKPIFKNSSDTANQQHYNRLPFSAYAKIWNDWYRDQNVQDEILINNSDGIITIDNNKWNDTNFYNSIQIGRGLAPVSKLADYFTTALPFPQKGDETNILNSLRNIDIVYNPDGNNGRSSIIGEYVDENGNPDDSAILSINELRYAIAIQQFKELDARGGTRYIEIVKNHFNVDSQDLRTQRAQFLGGVSKYIQMIQVNQTTPGNNTNGNSGVGATGAQSITTIVGENIINKSFTEHGFLMVVASVRVEHSYSQGIDKIWRKTTKYDYYWPKLDNIGEQPIYRSEIYFTETKRNETDIFGYQPAWSDYRYKQNKVNGYFSPNVEQSLKYWTYTDDYQNAPVLNDEWMRENKANVAQTLTFQNQHQYIAVFFFKYIHSRVMKVTSIPGLDKI